jgi:hypothetical protein
VLNRLIEGGEVAKEELPGGTTGYKLLREESTAFPARPAAEPEEEPAAPEAAEEAAPEAVGEPAPGDNEPRLATAA